MKNIIKLLVLISLTMILTVTLFANNDGTYVYENDDITIKFAEDTHFTESERTKIISYTINGTQMTTFNLICDLLGHSMGASETMVTTSHRVYSTAPRCKVETYSISTCTRCSYVSSRLIGSASMSCCS